MFGHDPWTSSPTWPALLAGIRGAELGLRVREMISPRQEALCSTLDAHRRRAVEQCTAALPAEAMGGLYARFFILQETRRPTGQDFSASDWIHSGSPKRRVRQTVGQVRPIPNSWGSFHRPGHACRVCGKSRQPCAYSRSFACFAPSLPVKIRVRVRSASLTFTRLVCWSKTSRRIWLSIMSSAGGPGSLASW